MFLHKSSASVRLPLFVYLSGGAHAYSRSNLPYVPLYLAVCFSPFVSLRLFLSTGYGPECRRAGQLHGGGASDGGPRQVLGGAVRVGGPREGRVQGLADPTQRPVVERARGGVEGSRDRGYMERWRGWEREGMGDEGTWRVEKG